MYTVYYLLFAASYILLLAWGLKSSSGTRLLTWSSFVYLVTLGLIYDNTVMGIGKWIGEGSLLEYLNALRYWSHAFLTPLLVLYSVGVLRESGIQWATRTWVTITAVFYTISLIILEVWLEASKLELVPVEEYGVLRYVSTHPSTWSPVMIILVTIVLLIASGIVWQKIKWPWFFFGTIVMTIGSLIPIEINSNAITNGFELFLMWTLIWTKKRIDTSELRSSIFGRMKEYRTL